MSRTPSGTGFVLLLAGLSAIGPFCVDTYLPSFHDIGVSLGASQTAVQQTMTAYLAAFALMTLWHGALSDSFGRRRVILVGNIAITLASLGCALAQTLPQLITYRILQGLCAGSGLIVARAVVRDCQDGASAQRLMSKIAILFALAPSIAPMFGGLLQQAFGWRAVFYFLTFLSCLLGLACYRYLPETLPVENRQPFTPAVLLSGYRQVLGLPRFVFLALALSFLFSGFFLYALSAPAFLMGHLGLKENQFYWLFVPATLGMIVGSWLSGRKAGVWSVRKTLGVGFVIMLAAALANLLLNVVLPPGLPWSVLPLPFYALGMALAMPSITLLALDEFPQRRGMAASCQSFVQTFCGSILAGLIAPFLWTSTLALAVGMFCAILIGTLFLALGRKFNASIIRRTGESSL